MRRAVGGLTVGAALAVTTVVSPAGIATTARPDTGSAYGFCPPAEHLVGHRTQWAHQRLAPGVRLAETTAHDGRGTVDIHVVVVNLRRNGVRIHALHQAVGGRHPLTDLAARRHLVAATNGMYFDLRYGAPVVPLVDRRSPYVLSTQHQHVAGIGADGRPQDGDIWLRASVTAGGRSSPVVAVNDPRRWRGLAVYTAAWGAHPVPLGGRAISRQVTDGRVQTGAGRHLFPPSGHGSLLVARGRHARHYLRQLHRGEQVRGWMHVSTDAPVPFREAYGVGTKVVAQPGQVRDHLYCRRGEIFAARTAIAWSADGRRLALITVSGASGRRHGLDENQMSGLLVAIGAARGFALDGGGSTTLVTRRPGQHRLTVRTAGPTGQRPVPVGIGVFSRRH